MSIEPTRTAPSPGMAGLAPGSTPHVNAYIDWPAILAGALVASAIFWVLNTFGSAIGLAVSSPYPGERPPAPLFLVAAGLWLVWVTASSHMAGGYIAGRMRRRAYDATAHESDVRDAVHGLVVWSVGVLIGAVLLALAAAGAGAGVDAASNVQGAAQQLTGQAADIARKAGVVTAFVVAASLAIGAAAAGWGATIGGRHRDENVDTSWWWWRRA